MRGARTLLAGATAMLGACSKFGDVAVVAPLKTIPLATVLRLLPDSEDLASAQALGWEFGIPNADVSVTAKGDSTPRAFRSDSLGRVDLGLLPANTSLEVRATRWLDAAQRTNLGTASDVVGFAAREVVSTGSAAELPVPVPASRRHGLVIAEWSFLSNNTFGGLAGEFNGYLELYNNADTTIYLDGMLVGAAFSYSYAFPWGSCGAQAPFKTDPEYLWAREIYQLPGNGTQYPIAPGQTSVLATDAINYQSLFPNAHALDLSHADFEFIGPADVDNPSVPNLASIGPFDNVLGHGLTGGEPDAMVAFVTVRTNLGALPIRHAVWADGTIQTWVGLPKESVLETIAIRYDFSGGQFAPCGSMTHPNFDRQAAHPFQFDWHQDVDSSAHRSVAFRLGDGRAVLQYTRSSYADFIKNVKSPGQIP